jgi:hypothetical protein
MLISSIHNVDLFKIQDEDHHHTFYGFDQEWFNTEWQRRAGCGPTVVASIMYYLNYSRSANDTNNHVPTKKSALSLMEEVYQYVTPTSRGIPSTKLLYEDVIAYAKVTAQNMKLGILNVSENQVLRPPFHSLISFLDKALCNDTPIAFLNLDNGDEKRLDSWHWVTIISLEYALDLSIATINILDGGAIKTIDLAKWFLTTIRGGGFVSFDFISTF